MVAFTYNRDMPRARLSAIVLGLALAGACLSWPAGCNPSAAKRQQLTSGYPLDRARGAVALAEAGDTEAVDLLIELLNDRDRAVRMYTILALERLCGETYGYNYYDPEPERSAAIARWREARQRGEVTVRRRTPVTESRENHPRHSGKASAPTAARANETKAQEP